MTRMDTTGNVTRRSAVLTAAAGLLLAACRSQQAAPAKDNKPKAASGPALFWMGMNTAKDNPVVDTVTSSFKEKNPAIDLTIEWEGNMDKLKASVAGGAPPEMMHTQSYVQTTWGVGGVVQALDSQLKLARYIKPEDVWPLKWNEVVFKGKTYALPYSLDTRVVYMNTAVMNEAGVDVTRPP